MKEERRWLQQTIAAYDNLLKTIGQKDMIIDESKIHTLFPIFQNKKFLAGFNIHQQKGLYLFIYFTQKDEKEIFNWFVNNDYNHVTIAKVNEYDTHASDSEWILEIPVAEVIQTLLNHEVKTLRNECEELAQPFYQNLENQLLSEYEEQCLQEDEYYLGVKFLKYNGEYPIYCFGTVYLEIEGIPYEFDLQNLQSVDGYYDIDSIKPDAFDENIRRYYNEIMRLLKKHLRSTCCGGCE